MTFADTCPHPCFWLTHALSDPQTVVQVCLEFIQLTQQCRQRVPTQKQNTKLHSAGAAEPLALRQDGKPILDMHTQVTEERVCEGPLDFVARYLHSCFVGINS